MRGPTTGWHVSPFGHHIDAVSEYAIALPIAVALPEDDTPYLRTCCVRVMFMLLGIWNNYDSNNSILGSRLYLVLVRDTSYTYLCTR